MRASACSRWSSGVNGGSEESWRRWRARKNKRPPRTAIASARRPSTSPPIATTAATCYGASSSRASSAKVSYQFLQIFHSISNWPLLLPPPLPSFVLLLLPSWLPRHVQIGHYSQETNTLCFAFTIVLDVDGLPVRITGWPKYWEVIHLCPVFPHANVGHLFKVYYRKHWHKIDQAIWDWLSSNKDIFSQILCYTWWFKKINK